MAFKKWVKRNVGRIAGSAVGGPIGYGYGAAYDEKRRDHYKAGAPTNQIRDQYGNLLYGDPDVGIDPSTGMPRDLPTGKQAPGVQHAADIWTRRFQLQQGEAASGTLQNALQSISTYRPGSAAARASGLYGQLAQTHLSRAQMTQSPYLLYWADRDAQSKARKDARNAGYAQIAGQVIGTAIGAAGGPVGAAVGNYLGGQLGQTAGQQYFGGTGATEATMGFAGDAGQAYQASGGAAVGPVGDQSIMQGSGGLGPMQAGLGGGGGQGEPPQGPQAKGPPGPRPGGGPGGPQGGPGAPQGGPQQGGGTTPQGPGGAPGAAPMALAPSFPQTEARFGIPSPRVSVAAMEAVPGLDPMPWLDALDDELMAMVAEDMYESPFAGVIT